VDGPGTLISAEPVVEFWIVRIGFPPEFARYFVHKGSVAVEGISLTVAGLGERQFDVMIIPFTWANTSLKNLRKGDKVNLECDMIGKYVVRAMDLRKQ